DRPPRLDPQGLMSQAHAQDGDILRERAEESREHARRPRVSRTGREHDSRRPQREELPHGPLVRLHDLRGVPEPLDELHEVVREAVVRVDDEDHGRTLSCGPAQPACRAPLGDRRPPAPGRDGMNGTDQATVLSVVVPVWGRRHDLSRLLPALRRALDGVEPRSEVLVCGSDPSLHRFAEAAGGSFIQSKRPGYGETLRTGFESAQGEWVLTMDADFAYAADFVPVMWAHRKEAEVVIGSRYVRGAVAEMGFSRRTVSRLLNAVYRFGLSMPFRDLSSGFRLYRRRVLLDIQP